MKSCFHAGLALAALVSVCADAASAGKTIASLDVRAQHESGDYVPVGIDLDALTALPATRLRLVSAAGGGERSVPFQISGDKPRTLTWLAHGGGSYTLRQTADRRVENTLSASVADGGLLAIEHNGQKLLGYQYETVPVPEGVDPAYRRGGFIHPLWSPRGQVLTHIQPPDHYHHYGIWNPWTHVGFAGGEVDLWNLAKKQGTVRFAGFESRSEGPVFSGYSAVHEHIVFGKDGGETTAMNELQTVRVYRSAGDYYLFDMRIELSCATDEPVALLEYRYGGFGWRATREWGRHNSEMLSSEGRTRKDIDNTRGRWFYVQGEVGDDYAGAQVMSHPDNFNHPEPMRMWGIPEDPREHGEVFASFSPTRDRDWPLEPGKTYTRNYRFVVYNGRFNKERAESGWKNFAHPPVVQVRRH